MFVDFFAFPDALSVLLLLLLVAVVAVSPNHSSYTPPIDGLSAQIFKRQAHVDDRAGETDGRTMRITELKHERIQF